MNKAIYKCNYDEAYQLLLRMVTVAKKFHGSNINNTQLNNSVLALGRYYHYNSTSWNITAGSISSKLIDTLKSTDSYLDNKLKSKIVFIDPNKNEVDFAHLCATLDAYFTASSIPKEWGGWQGDLGTLTLDVVKAANNSQDYDFLISKAQSMLGSPSYSFSKEDIASDIDAENIYRAIISKPVDVVTAFKTYYFDRVNFRFDKFIKAYGADAFYIIKAGPSDLIYQGLASSGYPGLGKTPSQVQKGAVYGAFASFVFKHKDSLTM